MGLVNGRSLTSLLTSLTIITMVVVDAKFVVEKESIRVLNPEEMRSKRDGSIANFGLPDYGGFLIGSVVYPESKTDGCSTFGKTFKPKFPRPTILLLDRGGRNQACQFGETVLSLFRPKLLIVSTPNYEYNKFLHKSAPDYPRNKSMSQLPMFRNHDHKFEWTRKQFNQWASKLAKRHNYIVEFSGVGGSGKADPGFASQIAVLDGNLCLRSQEARCSLIKSYGNGQEEMETKGLIFDKSISQKRLVWSLIFQQSQIHQPGLPLSGSRKLSVRSKL